MSHLGRKEKNRARYEKLEKALPKHSFKVTPAAKEAGFSDSYAETRTHVIWRNYLKYLEERALENIQSLQDQGVAKRIEKKQLHEALGLQEEDVYKEYSKIATQDRDLSTKFKAITPLLKGLGFDITDLDAKNGSTPTLNITVREQDNNLREPQKEPVDVSFEEKTVSSTQSDEGLNEAITENDTQEEE